MKEVAKKIFAVFSALLPGAASFFITAGWNWYHIPHTQKMILVRNTVIETIILWILFTVAKKILIALLRRKNLNPFWTNVFPHYFNRLYCAFSLLFLVFFSKNEIISLVYFAFALTVFFFTLESILKQHPAGKKWVTINRLLFFWAIFLFALNAVNQYTAFRYYILDPEAKYYNVSLFRAWAMASLWLGLFSISYLWLLRIKSKMRYFLFILCAALFAVFVLLWTVNMGILYFSGLNLTPAAVLHAGGSTQIMFNKTTLVFALFGLTSLILFVGLKKMFFHYHKSLPRRYWQAYHWAIIFVALFSIASLSSFRTAPEFAIIKSFYQYITGTTAPTTLSPVIQEKLKRFGINYNYDEFYLAHKENVFPTSSPSLLPTQLQQQKPNVIIIFLESFSSRLTSVYNQKQVPSATPGLEEMASNPNTTIFKNYYNGSTPTVTGLITQMCSFLPPTGHEEIEKENRLRNHHLLCLPKILEQNGWQYSSYITAVEKNYANKDTIFESMGTDEVYGTEELRDIIKAEPLAWGFSDHQLFPALESIISNKKQPYLAILSTVDTHPPFTIAKDMINYKDGKNNVLNSAHTTDDAFRIFWEKFIASEKAKNTIVIAVADHAIFPTAITKDYFPDVAGKLNFYDETTFLMYVPNSILPKEVDHYSSSIDFTPTILNVLGVNTPNAFDGHSIFSDREQYPNLLGMHEFGLYINEKTGDTRTTSYTVPSQIDCSAQNYSNDPESPLTLCEFLNFYQWKRKIFEEGRFWELDQNKK